TQVHHSPSEVAQRGEHRLPDLFLASDDRDQVEEVGDVRPAPPPQHGAFRRRGLVERKEADPLAGAILGGEEVERSGGECAVPRGLELPRRERNRRTTPLDEAIPARLADAEGSPVRKALDPHRRHAPWAGWG